jgi:cobalt/nickel transport system permease protein
LHIVNELALAVCQHVVRCGRAQEEGMHIPDGYLSPETCAVMYAAAAPFWYIALQRVKRLLSTRLVPLLAVFSAFSFVIMMFNLPLPGGTTGHAVGMGIATIVLGPWGSMLAVSAALLIQALFFGDGGITAFGANCFNMAVVGSLVAYWVYRAIAGRAAIMDTRRVVAAAIAGYIAINVAALFAAIEFGIQPMLFKDASGAPLYAPYPLSVAIPAMALGHLTIAGLAELIVTGGVVAYLQRSDPSLLKLTAPGAQETGEGVQEVARRGGWRASRSLWIGLAILMILSPLGLLAAGTAWGEWAPEDFNNPAVRQEIQAGSINQAPPEQAPQGLDQLSSFWSAPIPGYAPPWMHSESFGYIMSALVGAGLIILAFFLIGWIARLVRGNRDPDAPAPRAGPEIV